jgi:biopolymer transport protein ExbD
MATQVKTFSDINITPLTDIFLVLLIIMMVVAPLMNQSDPSIKVPSVTSGSNVEPNRSTVEINQSGQFFVNGKAATEAELATRIKADAPNYKEPNLVIRGDKKTPSRAIVQVMQAAREAGLEKVIVAGEPLASKPSIPVANTSASPKAPKEGAPL